MASEPKSKDVARSVTDIIYRSRELVLADYHGKLSDGETRLLTAVYVQRACDVVLDPEFKMGRNTPWEEIRAQAAFSDRILDRLELIDEIDEEIDGKEGEIDE